MDGFLDTLIITVVASVAGGLLAMRIQARMDRAFQAPSSLEDAVPIVYPRSGVLLVAAFVLRSAWSGVPVLLVPVLLTAVFDWHPLVALVPVVAFASLIPIGVALMFLLRCVQCGKRLLAQEVSAPPFADEYPGLNAYGATVMRITKERRCRCMYCGQQYLIRRA